MGQPTEKGIKIAEELSGTDVLITPEEGNKGGYIGSLRHKLESSSRTENILVFLPNTVAEGKQIRVNLQQAIDYDRNGNPLFRARLADELLVEKWKDNGDGTLTQVKVSIDWQLQETEVEVVQTRAKKSREGDFTSETVWSLDLGLNLEKSRVTSQVIRNYPIETEDVINGKLFWVETGHREEQLPKSEFQTSVVSFKANASFYDRFTLAPNPDQNFGLTVVYIDQGTEVNRLMMACWKDIPSWLQAEWDKLYPVCSCGRKRYSMNPVDQYNTDGFNRCEDCRKEQICERCSQQKEVQLTNGKLICDSCESLETMEHLIHQVLPTDKLQQISDHAQKLLASQLILDRAQALTVLKSAGVVIPTSWEKYDTFYFREDGVFGSLFSQVALSVLELLPLAQGNQLVTLVAWLVQGHPLIVGSFRSNKSFYELTQIDRVEVQPDFDSGNLNTLGQLLIEGKPVLASYLTESITTRSQPDPLPSTIDKDESNTQNPGHEPTAMEIALRKAMEKSQDND